MFFKSCPRCETGDVILERDFYGRHLDCLQCGYMKDIDRDHEAYATIAELQGRSLAREKSSAGHAGST